LPFATRLETKQQHLHAHELISANSGLLDTFLIQQTT